MDNRETSEKAKPEQVSQFMTTEHFTLQTAKAATVSEANGRISLYIGAVSSGLIALAFIGQMSAMSQSFYVFALVLFAALVFLGIVTFNRMLLIALEDWIYTHKIDRIRRWYAELAPEINGFFTASVYDDPFSPMRGIIPKAGNWQFFLTGSGMVSGINSILVGVFAGLLCKFAAGASTYTCAAVGIVCAAASVYLHYRRQIKGFTEVGNNIKNFLPFDSKPQSSRRSDET